jgi:4-amino-4-deoxy-L-arabinose transferase-like glycosyltransferase
VFSAIVLAVGLGGHALIEPDEGRNAEVAREMAATNDYLLPHLNGLPYLDKPVLFFASAALAIEVLGPREQAVRLAPFLFGLATVVLVGWFARKRLGLEAGMVAAAATLTAPLMVGLSRTVIMDTALAFFVVLALVSFFEAVECRSRELEEGASRHTRIVWTLTAWAAMGLGVLTKGPVALAVPLMVAAPYALRRRASAAVWHPLGPVLLVAIVAPWIGAVSRRIPGFLSYVVVTETWARMTTDELRRSEPWWFFAPVILAGTFPWWMLVSSGGRPAPSGPRRGSESLRVYAWLWLLVPLVFFSLSRGKQEQYVLPLVPAVALLAASRWSRSSRGVRWAGFCWAACGLVALGATAAGLPGLDPGRVPFATVETAAVGFAVVAIAGGVLAWVAGGGRRGLAVVGLSLPLVALPLVVAPALEAVAATRSARGLAHAIEGRIGPGTEILWIEAFSPGLSFYLNRTIPLLSADGDELRSNYILRNWERFSSADGPLRPLTAAARELAWCRPSRVLVVGASRDDLRRAISASGTPVLAEGRRWVAFGPDCGSAGRSADGVATR